MSHADALQALDRLEEVFTLMRDERTVFDYWKKLIDDFQVRGKPAHDARLVAAMQRHGLTHLLTFNATDFKRYSGIQVLEPPALAAR